MQLSTYLNGDKKALVKRENYNYTVEYYMNNRIVSKEIVKDYQVAEDLAEDYVMNEGKSGPNLLNENA